MSACLGESRTDMEMFAKEERVIALSACCHRAHAEASPSFPPSTYDEDEGLKAQNVMLTVKPS